MENIHNGAQYYTIQPGDTLVSICMKEFSSLEKMDEIICSMDPALAQDKEFDHM